MKIVVTGGSGFVGRHVALAAVAAGHECTVFDLHPLPVDLVQRGIHLQQGSLMSPGELRAAFEGADAVCHLAGVGDVYLAAEQPALAAELNVAGSANVADACLAEGVGRLVYASTWEVYGHPHYEPLDEEHPTNPDHPYNITKLAGEQIVLAYDALKGLPAVALRLGTAYGTGMRPNSVFSIFIGRALRGEAITISGDGGQHRQFTHASDIGRAFIAAAESDLHGQVFNIVANERVTIRELAEAIVAEAPSPLSFGEPRPGDISPAEVSSKRALARLGWASRVRFRDGLRALIEQHRANL